MIGYYASVLTIEILGRKWIQIQGFLMAALFCMSLPPSTRSQGMFWLILACVSQWASSLDSLKLSVKCSLSCASRSCSSSSTLVPTRESSSSRLGFGAIALLDLTRRSFRPLRTTYCYPAEVFPTRYRAFAHGISAASGKAGAILSALAFNSLSKKVGTPVILWSEYSFIPFFSPTVFESSLGET